MNSNNYNTANLISCMIVYFCVYSDEGYAARMQLAILDHNSHVDCAYREGEHGGKQMQRVWRRRSKRWDVVPRKVKKDYKYIPELMMHVLSHRASQDVSLRESRGKRHSGSSITPDAPVETADIVSRKRSRFVA